MQATERRGDELATAVEGILRNLKALRQALPVETAAMPLLGLLMERGGQRLSDLASCACLDVSTASRHVRTLEEAGLVERAADPDDRRASRISLTRSGRAALRKLHETRTTMFAQATAAWSDEDVTTLTQLLRRLADDLAPAEGLGPGTDRRADELRPGARSLM